VRSELAPRPGKLLQRWPAAAGRISRLLSARRCGGWGAKAVGLVFQDPMTRPQSPAGVGKHSLTTLRATAALPASGFAPAALLDLPEAVGIGRRALQKLPP